MINDYQHQLPHPRLVSFRGNCLYMQLMIHNSHELVDLSYERLCIFFTKKIFPHRTQIQKYFVLIQSTNSMCEVKLDPRPD